MGNNGIVTLIIIIANAVFSYKGFTNQSFFESYKFEVDKVLINKDYKRLVTGGFLHVGWSHLIFNMISLYLFSGNIEGFLGALYFLLIYMSSLIGGHLFTLLVHRQHGGYNAVGASGGVCGIIFASIALFPGMDIGIFFIPFSIPGWLYGILFVLYSVYGTKSQRGNIGHEAHLGGALVGVMVSILIEPAVFIENYITILLITVPTIAFIYIIISKPHFLLIHNFFFKTHQKAYTIDQKYNFEKSRQQKEIDKILDKINKKGMDSLSTAEKQKLSEYSKKL